MFVWYECFIAVIPGTLQRLWGYAGGFFFFLFVCPMYLIIRKWDMVFLAMAVAVMCGVVKTRKVNRRMEVV